MTTAYRTLGLTCPVAEILDPDLWRRRYAFGLPLQLDGAVLANSGGACADACARVAEAGRDPNLQAAVTELDPSVIRYHLRAALSDLELRLGVPLGIVSYRSEPLDERDELGRTFDQLLPRRPYVRDEAADFYRLRLPPGCLSIERIRGVLFGTVVLEVSRAAGNGEILRLEWPKVGEVHMIPVNLQAVLLAQGSGYALSFYELMQRTGGSPPDFWAIDCTCGPTGQYDGTPGQIELVLAHWVGLRAARAILPLLGDATSRGVTSTSTSFDGYSTSVSLASGQGGLYSATLAAFKALEEEIDWKRLRTYKRGLRVIGFHK